MAGKFGVGKKIVGSIIDSVLAVGNGAVSALSGLLATMLVVYSSYVIYDTVSIQNNATSVWQKLLEYKPEIIVDGETPLGPSHMTDINPDYRAWLTVYDTSIDYPVVQGGDDLYYAAHDIYKNTSLSGAIYLAAGNSGDFSDSYSLIYGHHMDNGAMFGTLDNFMDGGYLAAHREGIIVTETAAYDMTIFAVVSTDAYEDKIYNVGNRRDELLSFLGASPGEDGRQPGGVGVGTTVHFYDAPVAASAEKVLALSTCASAATSGRLVVFARLSPHPVPERKTYTLTITYTLEDGTPIATTYIEDLLEGEEYSVPSPEIPGYTAQIVTVDGTMPGADQALTVVYVRDTISLTLVHVWEGDQPSDRPAELRAQLVGGGETRTVTLTAANGWTATVSDLPADGEYYWTVPDVSGYTRVSARTDGTVTTVTSRKAPERRTYTLTITYTLEDGTPIATTYIENLLEGEEYSVPSPEIPGYTAQIVTVDGTMPGADQRRSVVYVRDTISLTLVHVWEGDEPSERPAALRAVLVGGGETRTVTLTAANGWTATVSGLPADGEYYWMVPDVSGYTRVSARTDGTVTTVTSRKEPPPDSERRTYTLTITYTLEDGTPIATTYIENLLEGEEYSVPSPEIPGYRTLTVVVDGTMPGWDKSQTVLYVPISRGSSGGAPDYTIIGEYGTPLGVNGAYIDVGDCFE